jgi:hypothetical protein
MVAMGSAKPGVGLKRGARARLAIYGMAVGELCRAAKWAHLADDTIPVPPRVYCVDERTWTRGVPKAKRQRRIMAEFPQYAALIAARDCGGDVSDAIGIALWWFGHEAVMMKIGDARRPSGARSIQSQ